MKNRKLIPIALAVLLTVGMVMTPAGAASAMEFGAIASSFDASFAAPSYAQQVELSVNLASMQAEVAQWQTESSLAAAQQLEATHNTPVVSEGGSLNGGVGDPNTIIVQGGTPIVGGSKVEKGHKLVSNTGTIVINEGTIQKNDGTVQINHYGTVEQNNGTVLDNRGTVQTNYRIVQKNYGTVVLNSNFAIVNTNQHAGTVQINDGAIETNDGTVLTNYYGTVKTNKARGTVQTNNGTVQTNNGTVQKNYGTVQTSNGTVQKNYGTVQTNEACGTVDNYTNGIVTLNKEGGIVFNYGGVITENLGTELFQVTINRSTNALVTDAADGLTAHNGEAWKKDGKISSETASITISPAAGYTITNIAAAEGISPVQNDDGTWTVTVDASLVNANAFTLDTTVTQNAPPSISSPVNSEESNHEPLYYNGYLEPTFYDDPNYYAVILSLLDITLEPAPVTAGYDAGPNAYDSFNDASIAELSAAEENGTVTIDLRKTGWTTLKREVFEAAARRGDVTIVILYNHFGRDYTLTIPAGTEFSILFEVQFLEVSQLPALLHLT